MQPCDHCGGCFICAVVVLDCIIPYRCFCYCVYPVKSKSHSGFAEHVPANWLALPKSVSQ